VEMWSVSAITLFSLTGRVSCFLLTFNPDTHFGFVSLVTHACDVPPSFESRAGGATQAHDGIFSLQPLLDRRPECPINVVFE
jgi:hypothetical protein